MTEMITLQHGLVMEAHIFLCFNHSFGVDCRHTQEMWGKCLWLCSVVYRGSETFLGVSLLWFRAVFILTELSTEILGIPHPNHLSNRVSCCVEQDVLAPCEQKDRQRLKGLVCLRLFQMGSSPSRARPDVAPVGAPLWHQSNGLSLKQPPVPVSLEDLLNFYLPS